MELCSKGFDEVIRSRTACRKYKDQKVDDKLLDLILSETIVGSVGCFYAQLAPTAHNWQPYKIVIMKDMANREMIAKHMPEKNGEIIKKAAGVAVFLSDTGLHVGEG